MKQFFLAASVLALASVNVHAQSKPKMKVVNPAGVVKPSTTGVLRSSLDSFSYALGLNIANNLRQQGIENISDMALQRGFNDVFKKQPHLLNEQQANMCIQQTIIATAGKRSAATKAKGTAFLEANKKRAGVTTLPDGLQYEVLRKGESNAPVPKLDDTVVVHYAGTLIDGKKFDNSYDRGEPLTIPVSNVVRGWQEVLQIMHVGDKFKVFIPSELAYGDRGAGADIPGGSTLIFEMELLGIKPAPGTQESPK